MSRWPVLQFLRPEPMLLATLISLTSLAAIGTMDVMTAPSAFGDNANVFTHWGHGYRPFVSAPDPNVWHFSSEAEYGWSVNGYPNGFCVGSCAPTVPCGFNYNGGGITVCFANADDLVLQGDQGYTYLQWVNDPFQHINAVLIFMCGNCGLSDFQFHSVLNQEYGHALGLGHTTQQYPCVMNDPTPTKFQCGHDRDAMAATYAPHYDG